MMGIQLKYRVHEYAMVSYLGMYYVYTLFMNTVTTPVSSLYTKPNLTYSTRYFESIKRLSFISLPTVLYGLEYNIQIIMSQLFLFVTHLHANTSILQ